MAIFSYVARDDTGQVIEGEVTAADQAEAARMVRSDGKFIVRIAAKGTKFAAAPRPKAKGTAVFGDKYRADDLIFFTNQLAVMVETGVSLADALEACVHDGNSPAFAKALHDVMAKVNAGKEFSASLAEHPRIFPSIYVSLIKASEASGMLAPMLERLAQHLQAQREMTKKIKGAVTYPIVMFVFAIGVTIFLMTYVLPKFTAIYAGREDKLPKLTRALMVFSDCIVDYGLYVLAVLIALGIGMFLYFRSPLGRYAAERIKLSLPMLGRLFHKAYLARSLRTLGTMIQSGVSMLDSVKLTSGVCGSQTYEQLWNSVNERLESGQQLSDALAERREVPKAVRKMLHAGERSGKLGNVMERVAIHCENDLNMLIKSVTSLIEPAIVMFLGVVVGGLVLALLLPIFTISKAMK